MIYRYFPGTSGLIPHLILQPIIGILSLISRTGPKLKSKLNEYLKRIYFYLFILPIVHAGTGYTRTTWDTYLTRVTRVAGPGDGRRRRPNG